MIDLHVVINRCNRAWFLKMWHTYQHLYGNHCLLVSDLNKEWKIKRDKNFNK
jgi:hypothetical protein